MKKNQKFVVLKISSRYPARDVDGTLSSESYSFVHNFSVHFKPKDHWHLFDDKIDISINTPTPELPSLDLVRNQLDDEMTRAVPTNDKRAVALGSQSTSIQITKIQYKETFAIVEKYNAHSPTNGPMITKYQVKGAEPQSPKNGAKVVLPPIFCRGCGATIAGDSKFCRKCGRPVLV